MLKPLRLAAILIIFLHSYAFGGEFAEGVTPSEADENVLFITVNGSLCSPDSYINKPCVSVTLCTTGTNDCQTINDILLDTGSFGLRIFKQLLTIDLAQEVNRFGRVAECVHFADGSSIWGPVQTGDVILGQEPPVTVPIHVIDSTFGRIPPGCFGANESPSDAGFNGILGVGTFIQDCGDICAKRSRNGIYYACNSRDCIKTAVPLSSQVQNPVALLPEDNNGVIVELPEVPPGGVPSTSGFLVLGIGTRPNNSALAVKKYRVNNNGDFTTRYRGKSYTGFIDSGSNGLFFNAPFRVLPDCGSPYRGWFCPASTKDFTAVNRGIRNSANGRISFQVGNFADLVNSPNNVFSEIGGDADYVFDWGLPFFLGRSVYFGIEDSRSPIGKGPYFAY